MSVDTDGSQQVTPLTILSGYLGAGKTTLLNRILNGDHGLRVAVLVNDFGPINIDAELVVGVEDDVIRLSNGCVCCQVRDDLVRTVFEVIRRPEKPEYILLEASGVADPTSLALTFVDAALREYVRLDSIISVVDAEQIFSKQDDATLRQLKLKQIGFSDMVILNKVDLVDEEALRKVRDWINYRLRRVRIVETNYCDVPLEFLLAVGRFDPQQVLESQDGTHDHDHEDHSRTFSTWSYETDQPMDLKALESIVRNELPGSVYRCKGIVYSQKHPQQRVILQTVGRRSEVTLGDEWGTRPRRTQIVAIGDKDGISNSELGTLFDSCHSTPGR